jgi:hypothetical protein
MVGELSRYVNLFKFATDHLITCIKDEKADRTPNGSVTSQYLLSNGKDVDRTNRSDTLALVAARDRLGLCLR